MFQYIVFVDFLTFEFSGKYALTGVAPKCGRLVGFCAGTDCLHGVRKLTKGRRCALPIWYTTRKEKETAHIIVKFKILIGMIFFFAFKKLLK